MSLFLDTSAIYAFMDASDENHAEAQRVWVDLLKGNEPIVTTSYVLVEVAALIQNRLGQKALQIFEREIMPVLDVSWVGQKEHQTGMAAVLSAGRRRLSLVDCVSFEVMTRLGIDVCFAFDAHFREQGFRCIP